MIEIQTWERTSLIEILGLIDEDFVNYRKCSMRIDMPHCDWKCGKENCQNYSARNNKILKITVDSIVQRYEANEYSEAIVIAGLEPFLSMDDLSVLIAAFREKVSDPIIIYTGYNKEEIEKEVGRLKLLYSNIIVKFGRYIPNQEPHYDEVLGIKLASSNQYAERIC
ncbi:4Fe-4S cluster-binding domain-containing protein [Massilibacteroides sp.]|uniref:4Fe-4S cluster-binding domain-containing protein n=1 Tax=Massilibacteroides sp. TaxID=2034766 RepID=UPI002609BEC1|nr:4Fe-4S cluster-binding domain-containing protein [Massilibacteroides sp.]MDD4516355.1 4Fe-4S cluster-binding domain-containing protein [Massilibacteroides sp.]